MIKLHRQKYSGRNSSSKGFTVVELLVVLLIIGILSTILVLTYSGIQQKQHNSTRISDVKLIQSHLEIYFAQNGTYPTLADMNNSSWRLNNLKGMDPNTVKDPLNKQATPTFSPIPIKDQYAYQPTATDGISPCDNKTVACAKYVLTATLEGSQPTFVEKSLN